MLELVESGQTMRILVVEDELRLRTNLANALREEGYAVDVAADGNDGLFKAETFAYHAMILDVMLPEMDGWEVLQRLRRKKDTPVLMLMARDAHSERIRGLDTRADDYSVKPFDLAELLARIRALIRRSAQKTTIQIELGDVVIETRSRLVIRAGQAVTLTACEYAILEYPALHGGKVISRTELCEHLFGGPDDTLSNLVDVHIFSVGKKLGSDVISTRRGRGYCIAARRFADPFAGACWLGSPSICSSPWADWILRPIEFTSTITSTGWTRNCGAASSL